MKKVIRSNVKTSTPSLRLTFQSQPLYILPKSFQVLQKGQVSPLILIQTELHQICCCAYFNEQYALCFLPIILYHYLGDTILFRVFFPFRIYVLCRFLFSLVRPRRNTQFDYRSFCCHVNSSVGRFLEEEPLDQYMCT